MQFLQHFLHDAEVPLYFFPESEYNMPEDVIHMKKWMYNALIIFFAGIFVVSGVFLARYYMESAKQKSKYDKLSEMLSNAPTTARPDVIEGTPNTEPTQPAMVEVTNPDTGETISILPEFAELYQMNNHLVGWISIPGTDIDYPVMQTPNSKDYYLKRDFDREYSSRGCIYVQETCDVFAPSDNLTIYGHRMRDRSMFAQLDRYLEKSFYEENPYIYFDTIQELHTYQIISVFTTTSSVGEGFRYHTFINATSPENYDQFVKGCKNMSIYDTGVTAEYGDKLITLSTCEYTHVNGRLVIVAKRIA